MNTLTPWFRQGRSSYGVVGPVSGGDRVVPYATTVRRQFRIEQQNFQEGYPESRSQRRLTERYVSSTMNEVLLNCRRKIVDYVSL